jgi:rhodanese-related sulfurtransferase
VVPPRRTLAELIEDAAARIERLEPAEALAAAEHGALIVDVRSDASRARDGVVPGSLHVPRTVLEWRFAPESEWRSPHACDPDDQVVVLCDHGYSSVFAAASLADLGYSRAGDVVGGFVAWRDAGLPTAPAPPERPDGELPGMGPPDLVSI